MTEKITRTVYYPRKRPVLTCKKCGEELKLNYASDIISLIEDGRLECMPTMKNSFGYMVLGLIHKKNNCGGVMTLSKTIKIKMKFEGDV